jgi:hypothetical protein
MTARMLLCTAILMSMASQAHALCKDDLVEMKPRIDHMKTADPQRYYLALKWWGRAVEAQPGSEVECDNFLARARKALLDPLPAMANCAGADADLAACQNGGVVAGEPVMPVMPIGAGDLGAGGGGGAVTATAPVTAGGGAVPFTPPGSVGSAAPSPGR